MTTTATRIVQNILEFPGTGAPVQGAPVAIQLNSTGFIDGGQREKIKRLYVTTDDTGMWSATLEVNAGIDPAETYWTVREINGVIWAFVVPDGDPTVPVWLRDCLVTDPLNPNPVVTASSVPPGGTSGQVLAKTDDGDYDTGWVDQSGGGGGAVSSVAGRTGAVVLSSADLTDAASLATTTALGNEATRAEEAEALALAKASNLSDLANAGTARTNLGLGTAATHPATDFATAAQGAEADTAVQDRNARPVVRLGIFPESANPTSEAEFETASGEPVTVLMVPYNYLDQPNGSVLTALNARGVTPLLDWRPVDNTVGATNLAYQLADIIAGTYDSYMTTFLTTIKGLGFDVIIKWAPEMNGNWYSWAEGVNGNTTGQYATAWQHVHAIADGLGITNISWMWNPTTDYAGSTALAGLYPGDAYVDMAAANGYNFGSAGPDGLRYPSTVYDATFDEIATVVRGKPLWLGECGTENTSGEKVAWYGEFFAWLIERGITGFVYFNSNDVAEGYDWRVNQTTDSAAAWAAGMATLRVEAQASGKAVAQADGDNFWTGRQIFYAADVIGIPDPPLPTPADIGAAPADMPNNWFSASATLAIWNAGTQMSYDSASPGTFTIPKNSSVDFGVGTTIYVFQNNVGALTIAGVGGVTVNGRAGSLTLATQYSSARLYQIQTDVWELTGDLAGVYQPLDSDLTAIAALSTTTYGRALLTLANQAALVTALGNIPESQVTGLTTDLAALIPLTQRGAASGVATLDSGGKLTVGQLPALAVNNVFTVSSQAAMLALAANPGDVAVRSDVSEAFMLSASPASTLGNWVAISIDVAPVTSVATRTGAIVLTVADVSGAAPLASPTFTGTVAGITAAMVSALALAGGTMTGAIAMGSHKITGLTNGSASSDAAAFGQIPTALPPNGTAGGDLTGTYPNPTLAVARALLIETVNTVGTGGAAQTIPDLGTATISRITLTANCTLTFPTAAAGKTLSVFLVQDATGSRTVTWPATVKWPAGTAPTLTTTASHRDVFTFVCTDGTNWDGFVAGLNYS